MSLLHSTDCGGSNAPVDFRMVHSLPRYYTLPTVANVGLPKFSQFHGAVRVLWFDSDDVFCAVLVRSHIGICPMLYTPSLYRKHETNQEARGYRFLCEPIRQQKGLAIDFDILSEPESEDTTMAELMPISDEVIEDSEATTTASFYSVRSAADDDSVRSIADEDSVRSTGDDDFVLSTAHDDSVLSIAEEDSVLSTAYGVSLLSTADDDSGQSTADDELFPPLPSLNIGQKEIRWSSQVLAQVTTTNPRAINISASAMAMASNLIAGTPKNIPTIDRSQSEPVKPEGRPLSLKGSAERMTADGATPSPLNSTPPTQKTNPVPTTSLEVQAEDTVFEHLHQMSQATGKKKARAWIRSIDHHSLSDSTPPTTPDDFRPDTANSSSFLGH